MSKPSTNWRNLSKPEIKKFCATRIVPYTLDKNGEISILLGLDSKYKEWTPWGGNCSKQQGSCDRQDTSFLKTCLARELSEESKRLVNLNKTVDFVNCQYIHYIIRTNWSDLHNNIYFAKWIGNDKETILKYFNDKERDKRLHKKLEKENKDVKSYFEMDTINFISLNYNVFGEYIYNTIQHFHSQEDMYRKDKVFYNQITDVFSALLREYPKDNELGNTDTKRFDPRFLLGIINSVADYFGNKYNYKNINDIVDDFKSYIKNMKTCSFNGEKIDISTDSESDTTSDEE